MNSPEQVRSQRMKTTKPVSRGKRQGREDRTVKPPRVLLCHCRKCDEKWTARMTLVADPEAPKEKPKGKFRGDRQKRMVWIFPPESFEHCKSCGARSQSGDGSVISCTLVHTDIAGRVKLTTKQPLPEALGIEDDELELTDSYLGGNLVQEYA